MALPLRLMLLAPVLALLTHGLRVGAEEARVSPGGSDQDGDGSVERPFLTITHALAALKDRAEAVVELAPGVYSRDSGESFPLQAHVRSSLTIRGPAQGTAVIRGGKEYALLEILVRKEAARSAVRLEKVQWEEGLTGIMAVGEEGARFDLAVEASRFRGQRYQGVEVVTGPGGETRASVKGNELDGRAAFGIDLGTRPGATLEVAVEDNRVEDASTPLPDSGSQPYRFGVAVYVEASARVRGVIDRNSFLNVPVGVVVTESEVEGDGQELDLRVSSCLIAGDAALDPAGVVNRLRHGFYLGLWPHVKTRLRLLNNTVVNASGYGIYQDEPVVFMERQENTALAVTGSIFWNVALGEFSAEAGGGTLPGYFREVRGNLLPRSSRGGIDGNISGDPRFAPGYELEAGSPAVDVLTAGAPGQEPEMPRDLKGACRVADGNGDGIYRMDLGALERAGACEKDSRLFIRADCDPNQSVEITDAVSLLSYLFAGGAVPACPDACDSDDDSEVNISDAVYTLVFLFLAGPAPAAPFPGSGVDSTADQLGPCR